jgi:hypothetical protein
MAEEPTLLRKKRKRSKYPHHWVIIPSLLLLACGWSAWRLFGPDPQLGPLPGYITSTEVFEQENARFYGKLSKNSEAEEKFQLAIDAVAKHDFGGAAALLEEASKTAALPVVFNNLGVLYAHADDPARTVNAFREALARDEGYDPARKNLEHLKGLNFLNRAYPVTREIEPNDSLANANLISLGKAVEGEIGSAVDVDWYRVSSPAPPRDLISIKIANRSKTLTPGLSFFDENMASKGPSVKVQEAGGSISGTLAPSSNATLYLKVEGTGGTAGAYTLAVTALKAFDAYEPNDEIFNASKIEVGKAIEANIMDKDDHDYYSFVSPRTGTVSIEIQNRSTTLIPALQTFTSDMRHSGFGPDVTKPGEGLRHSIEVQENQVYFLQVFSQGGTAGSYTLTVQ